MSSTGGKEGNCTKERDEFSLILRLVLGSMCWRYKISSCHLWQDSVTGRWELVHGTFEFYNMRVISDYQGDCWLTKNAFVTWNWWPYKQIVSEKWEIYTFPLATILNSVRQNNLRDGKVMPLWITLHLELGVLMAGVMVLYFNVIVHCDCASSRLA